MDQILDLYQIRTIQVQSKNLSHLHASGAYQVLIQDQIRTVDF